MGNNNIQPAGVFGHHRAALTTHYAVMPPEGILESKIPGIVNTAVSVQTSRQMGAGFSQLHLAIRENGGMETAINDGKQGFYYVISGNPDIEIDGDIHALRPGSYAYTPTGVASRITNSKNDLACVIWIRKSYEPATGLTAPASFVSHKDNVEKVNKHTQGRTWQHLLPENDLAFDFHVNILSFEPGNYFPMVETHVMEHGLFMLEGQGMYLLQHDWHECWQDDFIYMAPYCPQFFYATGWSTASYLLYKNVNRDNF
ncbi:TPA: (S)-ureidoglycine aminohydrolase [Klebsiella pneumoniae]